MFELWFWVFRKDELFRGFYFEATPSEEMMQTLDLGYIIDHPIRSFWYLHFQPPGFDFFRLVLALPEVVLNSQPADELLDLRIYLAHIVMFGIINAIIFHWAWTLTNSTALAFMGSLAWATYPGNIAMVTYLDSMYLSSFLFVVSAHLWLSYLKTHQLRYAMCACLAGTALTLTRTSLQPIIFAVIITLTYFVIRHQVGQQSQKRLFAGFLVCLLLTIASPVKQFALFGTFSSTSSGGHHLLGTIRYLPTDNDLVEIDLPARIVKNAYKSVNDFNTPEEVITNYRYSQIFFDRIVRHPILSLRESLVSAERSAIKGAGATQMYQRNVLVEVLPWSSVSAGLFSGISYVLFVLIGVALLFGLRPKGMVRNHGKLLLQLAPLIAVLVVMTATIFLGSLRYTTSAPMGAPFGWTDGFTWTESNRLKFIIESILFPSATIGVLVAIQLGCRQLLSLVQGKT